MEEMIIIAIAIGTGTGIVITVLIFTAYYLWKRNASKSGHTCRTRGTDLEKNEQNASHETSSDGSDGDYVVELTEVDSVSTMTKTVPAGMDITVNTMVQEWRNKTKISQVPNHHPCSKALNKQLPSADHASVGTIKINNSSNKGRVDDFSIDTEKINNCAAKTKVVAPKFDPSYLSGDSLTLHNAKCRSELFASN